MCQYTPINCSAGSLRDLDGSTIRAAVPPGARQFLYQGSIFRSGDACSFKKSTGHPPF